MATFIGQNYTILQLYERSNADSNHFNNIFSLDSYMEITKKSAKKFPLLLLFPCS